MRLLQISFLLGLLSVFGCQKYTTDKLPAERLHFGNSGGFTGEIREYILLIDSGRILFDNRITGEIEKIGKLKKGKLSAIVAELATVDFTAASHKPANINTRMTYHKDGQNLSLQWSGNKDAPSSEAVACFEELMAAVREMRGTE